ncbi:hypothetical protein EDD86DRAFT_218355 [Gorgonomyces haynaldii]|nr:hypothetical protein EDD86DRAFT_218355 [Gorgonomyces haynaldii]
MKPLAFTLSLNTSLIEPNKTYSLLVSLSKNNVQCCPCAVELEQLGQRPQFDAAIVKSVQKQDCGWSVLLYSQQYGQYTLDVVGSGVQPKRVLLDVVAYKDSVSLSTATVSGNITGNAIQKINSDWYYLSSDTFYKMQFLVPSSMKTNDPCTGTLGDLDVTSAVSYNGYLLLNTNWGSLKANQSGFSLVTSVCTQLKSNVFVGTQKVYGLQGTWNVVGLMYAVGSYNNGWTLRTLPAQVQQTTSPVLIPFSNTMTGQTLSLSRIVVYGRDVFVYGNCLLHSPDYGQSWIILYAQATTVSQFQFKNGIYLFESGGYYLGKLGQDTLLSVSGFNLLLHEQTLEQLSVSGNALMGTQVDMVGLAQFQDQVSNRYCPFEDIYFNIPNPNAPLLVPSIRWTGNQITRTRSLPSQIWLDKSEQYTFTMELKKALKPHLQLMIHNTSLLESSVSFVDQSNTRTYTLVLSEKANGLYGPPGTLLNTQFGLDVQNVSWGCGKDQLYVRQQVQVNVGCDPTTYLQSLDPTRVSGIWIDVRWLCHYGSPCGNKLAPMGSIVNDYTVTVQFKVDTGYCQLNKSININIVGVPLPQAVSITSTVLVVFLSLFGMLIKFRLEYKRARRHIYPQEIFDKGEDRFVDIDGQDTVKPPSIHISEESESEDDKEKVLSTEEYQPESDSEDEEEQPSLQMRKDYASTQSISKISSFIKKSKDSLQ